MVDNTVEKTLESREMVVNSTPYHCLMSYNILQSYRCLLKPTGGCSATAAVVNIATKEGRGEPLPQVRFPRDSSFWYIRSGSVQSHSIWIRNTEPYLFARSRMGS